MTPDRLETARTAESRAVDGRPPLDGPSVMDRYRLQRRLGTGAFGTVWMARDERLDRDVAVKILARQLISDGRFEREARAAARLAHPGIVTLYEAAVDDEGAYLVSELVSGETLDAVLAEGRLSDRDILEIGIALCEALAHAHDQGVVHRDVKPSNILIPQTRARGGRSAMTCKLTDFGVARVIDSDSLTHTGDIIGTAAYMAPEQAAGLEAGDAADLYALALVLYEALSGVNPVRTSPGAARSRRVAMHLPPLRRQRRDLPSELARAIDRALLPRTTDRGSIGELQRALTAAVDLVGEQAGIVTGAFDRHRDEDEEEGDATRRLWWSRPAEPRAEADRGGSPAPDGVALPAADPSRLIWQGRALAAAAAAATVAGAGHALLTPHGALTAPIAVSALVAAGLTLILPRIGWVALAGYLIAATAVQGHGGEAVVLAAGAIVPVILLPASPTLWPVCALAPALGVIGVGGAWPALAGWAGSPWRRVMLGATGWAWIALATPLSARAVHGLYLSAPRTIPVRPQWSGSPTAAAEHVLAPLARSGALAPAAVWAAAALVAPWLAPRTAPVIAAAGAALWAAATVMAIGPVLDALGGPGRPATASTAIAGGVAAAVLALVPALVDRCRRAVRLIGIPGRVP